MKVSQSISRRRLYFYLSYARSAPLPDAPIEPDVDYWVRTLHEDLSAEVRKIAGLAEHADVGFFDGLAPAGSDWAMAQLEALSAAEVFVPLYSPRYLDKQWSLRERESFRRRLATAPRSSQPGRHVLPVLWVPLPSTETAPEVTEALKIGEGVAGYADDGLRALKMLSIYSDEYVEIVRRLAQRIVEIADGFPIGYSQAPAVAGEFAQANPQGKTPYAIAVIAPTKAGCPPGASRDSYGATSTQWRPFGTAQAQPIVVYAATMAERLGLPTHTIGIPEGEVLEKNWPGVLLIDPWMLAVETGAALLRSVLAQLSIWVRPVVVIDSHHKERADALTASVTAMLGEFGIQSWSVARQVKEFVDLMPALVSDTRSQFLRKGPVFPPAGPSSERGSLRSDGKPRSDRWEGESDE